MSGDRGDITGLLQNIYYSFDFNFHKTYEHFQQ